jgi:hypothetical protein
MSAESSHRIPYIGLSSQPATQPDLFFIRSENSSSLLYTFSETKTSEIDILDAIK